MSAWNVNSFMVTNQGVLLGVFSFSEVRLDSRSSIACRTLDQLWSACKHAQTRVKIGHAVVGSH
jgi:hypothetical protein